MNPNSKFQDARAVLARVSLVQGNATEKHIATAGGSQQSGSPQVKVFLLKPKLKTSRLFADFSKICEHVRLIA